MMRACSGVLPLVLVLLLATGTVMLDQQEIIGDMRELRREVEQVRNEVRREEEGDRESDNEAVLLSWLVETVKQLQSEVRSLESEMSERECAQPEDIRRLQDQIDNIRQNNVQLTLKEERDIAAVEDRIELTHHQRVGYEKKVDLPSYN